MGKVKRRRNPDNTDNPHTKMSQFSEHIRRYTIPYGTANPPSLTHQFFAGTPKNLSVPSTERNEFYRSYIDYVTSVPEADLVKSNGPAQMNSLTERVPKVFHMFADLDLKMDIFTGLPGGFKMTAVQVLDLMTLAHETFHAVLSEAFPSLSIGRPVSAFRMFYKCHMFFPGVLVDAQLARAVCSEVRRRLLPQHGFLESYQFIDTSVYSTALRILYSHKGVMERKGDAEKQKHKDVFGEGISYLEVYRRGQLDAAVESFVRYNDVTLEDLEMCSIVSTEDAPVALNPTAEFLSRETTSVKRGKTGGGSTKRAKKSSSASVDYAPGSPDEVSSDFTFREFDANDEQVFSVVKSYLEQVLPSVNMRADVRTMSWKLPGRVIRVLLDPQPCPLAGRLHRRCERGSVANFVWIEPSGHFPLLKCFHCQGQGLNLPLPQANIFGYGVSDKVEDNRQLQKSLFNQTHETVGEFIFQELKGEYAASLVGKNTYNWYHYDSVVHRWIENGRIFVALMNEHGHIQDRYEDAVRNMLNDPSLDKEGKERINDLWKTLRTRLQTWGYVNGSLIPVLARKLDYHWSNLGPNDFKAFHERLDENPKLLGFTNGVWDFGSRVFRSGRPSDFISRSTNVPYFPYDQIPETVRDELDQFLASIFPKSNHRVYVLREISHALDGTPTDQRVFLMTGGGANGKSTLVRCLNLALGDYAGEANVTLFTKPRPPANAPTPELIDLIGKRFVCCSEPNAKDPIQLGTMKWLSGGDRITAAAKFQGNQSFYLQATFFILTNDVPPINATQSDDGTWRRIRPVTFMNKFVREPRAANELPLDDGINERMMNWREAFISLLIDVFLQDINPPMPPEFSAMSRKLRSNNDVFGRFLREACTRTVFENEELFTEKKVLFGEFRKWMESMGNDKTSVNMDTFEKHMNEALGVPHGGGDGWPIKVQSAVIFPHNTVLGNSGYRKKQRFGNLASSQSSSGMMALR